MGGAEDMPQRSSSPLKRPASELEPDVPLSSQKEDVDMVMVPDTQEDSEVAIAAPTAIRAVSMDMLRDESTKEDAAQLVTATENVQNIGNIHSCCMCIEVLTCKYRSQNRNSTHRRSGCDCNKFN